MGAWGTGPFENDLAMDWFTELEEETSFSVIRRKIEEVITDDYLDADLVQEAVASLAIIVAIKTGDEDLLPEFETSSLDNLIELFAHKINDNILSLCEDAFGIITREEDNELYELWEEEDLLEDWLAYIEDLQERL